MKRFPDGEHAALAMHRNIMLCLRLNRGADACAMAREFLKRFPENAAAAEVALHCGDALELQGDWAGARAFYLAVTAEKYGRAYADEAAYEAIVCDWRLGRTQEAVEALKAMLSPESKGYSNELLARAAMLYGDLLSSQSQGAAARDQYARARNFAGDTPLGLAALARQAEMLLSDGIPTHENLLKARNCLQPVLESKGALPPELKERARYLAARCATLMDETELAIRIYGELVTEYLADRKANIPHAPKYFALSAWDLSRLLEKQGGRDELRQAAHVLENYAAAGLPRAQEAAAKAAEIRARHNLGAAGTP